MLLAGSSEKTTLVFLSMFAFCPRLCVNNFPECGGVRSGERRQKKEQMLNYVSFAFFPSGDDHVIRVQLQSRPRAAIKKRTCADMHWKEAQINHQKKSQCQRCRLAPLIVTSITKVCHSRGGDQRIIIKKKAEIWRRQSL